MSFNILAELSGLIDTLDFHMARHEVLVGNIVNADTPGFIPQDLHKGIGFSQVLKQVTSHAKHIGDDSSGHGMAYEQVTQDHALRADGNGVSLEQSIAQVTANRLHYEEGLELTRRQLAMLRFAATDGGRA